MPAGISGGGADFAAAAKFLARNVIDALFRYAFSESVCIKLRQFPAAGHTADVYESFDAVGMEEAEKDLEGAIGVAYGIKDGPLLICRRAVIRH